MAIAGVCFLFLACGLRVLKNSGDPRFWESLYAFYYGLIFLYSGDHCVLDSGHILCYRYLTVSYIKAVFPTISGGSIYYIIITREYTLSDRNSCKSFVTLRLNFRTL